MSASKSADGGLAPYFKQSSFTCTPRDPQQPLPTKTANPQFVHISNRVSTLT